jgi:putative peptidoglycan lipid II flippase
MTTTPIDPAVKTDAAETIAPTRHLVNSTLIVILAFGTAKAISLAQTFIIARVFGVGTEWDTFVAANSIPETIFTLIAGGALGHAFIPVFSGFLAREDRAGAWQIASRVVNTVFLVALIASVIAFIFAPILVSTLVAPGFTPDAQAQTADLMRIALISTLIFAVSGLVSGVLQSFNRFLLPALAPILFDVGILFGVVFLTGTFGVYGIAYGAVLGAALHLSIQIPGLVRVKARWTPVLGWRDPTLRQIIRLMLPRIAGLGVFQLNFIVMNNIASTLGEGSVSALSWGWRLMQIPQTLIGTAMGVVIFPTLAALSARGDADGKREAMSGALRFILAASIPASIGLIVVGRPLISLLEGGAFNSDASDLVFSTLQFFALGIVVHSMLEVVARSFYADKDTLTPLWAALGGAAINLGLAWYFGTQGQVGGLALANSLGTAFEVLVLLGLLRRRWRGINETALGRTTAKALAASLVMALAVLALDAIWVSAGLADRGMALTVVEIGVQVIVGGIAFVVTAAVLRMEELAILRRLISERLTKRRLATV